MCAKVAQKYETKEERVKNPSKVFVPQSDTSPMPLLRTLSSVCRGAKQANSYMRPKRSNSKTTCFTLLRNRLTMGKVPFFSGKTTCFTGMTLYDTS